MESEKEAKLQEESPNFMNYTFSNEKNVSFPPISHRKDSAL